MTDEKRSLVGQINASLFPPSMTKEEEEEKAVKRIKILLAHLTISLHEKSPFLGECLDSLARVKVPSLEFCMANGIDTMCTDGWHIVINPQFASELSEEEFNFVILHALHHILLEHPFRFNQLQEDVARKLKLPTGQVHAMANIATDAAANAVIYNAYKHWTNECGIKVKELDGAIFDVAEEEEGVYHKKGGGTFTELDHQNEMEEPTAEDVLARLLAKVLNQMQNQQQTGGQSGQSNSQQGQSGNQSDNQDVSESNAFNSSSNNSDNSSDTLKNSSGGSGSSDEQSNEDSKNNSGSSGSSDKDSEDDFDKLGNEDSDEDGDNGSDSDFDELGDEDSDEDSDDSENGQGSDGDEDSENDQDSGNGQSSANDQGSGGDSDNSDGGSKNSGDDQDSDDDSDDSDKESENDGSNDAGSGDGSNRNQSGSESEDDRSDLEDYTRIVNQFPEIDSDMRPDLFSKLYDPKDDPEENNIHDEMMTKLTEIAAKDYSDMPGSIKRKVDIYNKKTKTNWKKYLRRFLSSKINEDRSYTKPDKVYLPYDLIQPGIDEGEEISEVSMYIDTSGSISDASMKLYLREAFTLVKEFGCKLTLVTWHTRVDSFIKDIEEDTLEEAFAALEVAGGGTSIECVYNHILEKNPNAVVYVILTDGCFSTVDNVPRWLRFKTIWAMYDEDIERQEKALAPYGRICSLGPEPRR